MQVLYKKKKVRFCYHVAPHSSSILIVFTHVTNNVLQVQKEGWKIGFSHMGFKFCSLYCRHEVSTIKSNLCPLFFFFLRFESEM